MMRNFAKRRATAASDPYASCRRIAITGMIMGGAGLVVSIGFVALTLMAGS
jgi:hypothetical protein